MRGGQIIQNRVRNRKEGAMEETGDNHWPVWKLAVLLYVFATGAVAINLFMLGLIGLWVGLPPMSPQFVLMLSVPLGIPAAWASGRWVRHLLDESAG